MFRKHGEEFVVKISDVWPLIPVALELTDEQTQDQKLVELHAQYHAWVADGNTPFEQEP